MRDVRDIIEAFSRTQRAGKRCALASVVHTEGSTYRRAGARALFVPGAADGDGGEVVGLVSGGCLEGDLVARAREVVETGLPARVRYDSRSDDDLIFGLGLGCRGVVDVLLECVGPQAAGPLDWLARCLERRKSGAIATLVRGDDGAPPLASHWVFDSRGQAAGPGTEPEWDTRVGAAVRRLLASDEPPGLTLRQGAAEIWIERVPRQTQLLIIGAGPDAPMLVDIAAGLGWSVVVVDPRSAYAGSERFAAAERVVDAEPGAGCGVALDEDTTAVIMSHQYARDREALRWLLPSPVPYLGVLGPRARTDELLADLAADGLRPSTEQLARLAAPAGLDIGGEGPHIIAVSIAAEIQAVLAGHPGSRLRERKAPIHEVGA